MIKVALVSDTAKLPTRKHDLDAGIDLYLDNPNGDFIVDPMEIKVALTGVTIEIPVGHFGLITNKSKSNYLIGGGVVDESYQGELLVKIVNPTHKELVFKHHDPIAQLLILPCHIGSIEKINPEDIHKRPSDRGISGGIVDQIISNEILYEDGEDDYNYVLDDFNFDVARERGIFGKRI